MTAFRNTLDRVLITACILLFVFMTCVGSYQIVTRYVFNNPSTVSEELITYSFTWMALLAATYVFGKRDHMRMSFFADRLSGRSGVLLNMAAELATLLFAAGVLTYGGIAITRLTMSQVTASLGISMGYVYLVIPVCGVLTMIYNGINLVALAGRLKSGEYDPPAGSVGIGGGAK